MIKQCVVCGNDYESKRSNSKYCSKQCSDKFWHDDFYKKNKSKISENARTDEFREKSRKYAATPERKKYHRDHLRKKRSSDPIWKLKHSIIDRIKLENYPNCTMRELENYLGYAIVDLYDYLMKSLPDGCVETDFLILNKLHLDHIIPYHWYITFDAGDEEFKKCWAMKNLRFLLREDNLTRNKKDKILLWKEAIDLDLLDILPKGANEMVDIIKIKCS